MYTPVRTKSTGVANSEHYGQIRALAHSSIAVGRLKAVYHFVLPAVPMGGMETGRVAEAEDAAAAVAGLLEVHVGPTVCKARTGAGR